MLEEIRENDFIILKKDKMTIKKYKTLSLGLMNFAIRLVPDIIETKSINMSKDYHGVIIRPSETTTINMVTQQFFEKHDKKIKDVKPINQCDSHDMTT